VKIVLYSNVHTVNESSILFSLIEWKQRICCTFSMCFICDWFRMKCKFFIDFFTHKIFFPSFPLVVCWGEVNIGKRKWKIKNPFPLFMQLFHILLLRPTLLKFIYIYNFWYCFWFQFICFCNYLFKTFCWK